MTYDEVKKPKHYNSHPSGVECITIAQHMTFCAGNALKYIWRAGLKTADSEIPREKHLEDLRKAVQYLKFEINRIEFGDARATETDKTVSQPAKAKAEPDWLIAAKASASDETSEKPLLTYLENLKARAKTQRTLALDERSQREANNASFLSFDVEKIYTDSAERLEAQVSELEAVFSLQRAIWEKCALNISSRRVRKGILICVSDLIRGE